MVLIVSLLAGLLCGVAATAGAGRWPSWALATVAMAGLAALDVAGALLARHWAQHRTVAVLVAGMVVFAGLFALYARSLSYATLSTVTLGWIVILQTSVVVIDHVERQQLPRADHLAVIAALLALQGYLVLTSSSAA